MPGKSWNRWNSLWAFLLLVQSMCLHSCGYKIIFYFLLRNDTYWEIWVVWVMMEVHSSHGPIRWSAVVKEIMGWLCWLDLHQKTPLGFFSALDDLRSEGGTDQLRISAGGGAILGTSVQLLNTSRQGQVTNFTLTCISWRRRYSVLEGLIIRKLHCFLC